MSSGRSGRNLKQFSGAHALACPSENEIYAAETSNWARAKADPSYKIEPRCHSPASRGYPHSSPGMTRRDNFRFLIRSEIFIAPGENTWKNALSGRRSPGIISCGFRRACSAVPDGTPQENRSSASPPENGENADAYQHGNLVGHLRMRTEKTICTAKQPGQRGYHPAQPPATRTSGSASCRMKAHRFFQRRHCGISEPINYSRSAYRKKRFRGRDEGTSGRP